MSKTWDTLLSSQSATGTAISKVITNLNRLGQDNITIDVLKVRLNQLETYWKTFYDKHQKIYEYVGELKESDYFKQDYFSMVEEAYLDAKLHMTTRLSTLVEAVQRMVSAPGHEAQGTGPAISTTALSLPKLKLPNFSGRQEDWESFKELFCSMVKDSPTLTPVLKLQHLVSCLEGDAKRRIENMPIIGANFEVAWNTLEARYDNKRLRLTVQLNKLMSMPPASSKSVAEINRLMDTTNQCIRSLRSLHRPVEHWDDWLVQLVVYNLDSETREDWEKSLEGTSTFPTYQTLTKFLENRAKALDTAHCSDVTSFSRSKAKSNNSPNFKSNSTTSKHISAHHASSTPSKRPSPKACVVCNNEHYIGYCPAMLQRSVPKRLELVDSLRLCNNCLRAGHATSACPSKSRCKHCSREHHSVLHLEQAPQSSQRAPRGEFAPAGPRPELAKVGSNQLNAHSASLANATLLGTARVILKSKAGLAFEFRALLDPCSEGSFVSERAAQALRLSRAACNTTVTGVGGEVTATASTSAILTLCSKTDLSLSLIFTAVILPRLSAMLPCRPVTLQNADYFEDLELADPLYAQPDQVDCILGGDIFPHLIQEGLRKKDPSSPVAQKTRLGWILTGPTRQQGVSAHLSLRCFSTGVSVADELRRFWEMEEVSPAVTLMTPEEAECEQHFEKTHSRDDEGRYIVRLPFRATPTLPASRQAALKRLLSLERRLDRDSKLQHGYALFLQEYEELGHMTRVSDSNTAVYLPHHPVCLKKLRVVFGAEQLNEYLHPGRKLQRETTTILTRWRPHRYVFTADIIKMFRQIRVHQEDCKWQRILWRDSPEHPIDDFELLTVTYGTSCAPYLALRVLQQLAEDEGEAFPLGAQLLREHFYVDDVLAGADSMDQVMLYRDQLIGILRSAGMQLDKWAANHPQLLDGVRLPASATDRGFNSADSISTLGLR